jgi:anaerobic selenocysteine-containing dehydrogenase
MRESLDRPARVVNMVELGKALATLDDPPIKALFVYGSNPAAVAPNHNLVVEQLRRDDLFTAVHEQFLTDTTDYADIVLPATTFFEHKDLQPSYGHYFLQVSQQAIAPVGEARSNAEVFRALAARMGFEDACFRESVDEMIDAALDNDHEFLQGITRERLEREGHVRLNLAPVGKPFLPFANGNFRMPGSKAELYSESLAAQGFDPIVKFVPPKESRHSGKSGNCRYPLELLARKADNFLNSSFCNLPVVRAMECVGLLEMRSQDADARGITDGQTVRVYNDRGAIELMARISDAIQPGVVAARLDWAKLTEQGTNINVLTSERLTDMGESATFYSVLVEVEGTPRD